MRAVLVELFSGDNPSKLHELTELSETLGHKIVAKIQQNRKPDPAFYIGRGKARELAQIVELHNAERVIFGNPLKPSQAFKLEELVGAEVIDRFQLILEIFAMRANSPEAKLQVEYARLNYELPRVRERVQKARHEEFPGFRGGGEYEEKIHVDDIKRRMNSIQKKLKSFEKSRQYRRERRRKRGFRLAAIAGYTNAGKSTLLNALSSADVEVDNMLFTTLSPRTRALRGGLGKVLLTDTIGFIDGLPPWMIEAFKAAIEEIFMADLILLLVDVSEPISEILRKVRLSREILEGCSAEVVTVLNKTDLVAEPKLQRRIEAFGTISPDLMCISAKEGDGLDSLVDLLRSRLLERLHVQMIISQQKGAEKILHQLHEETIVQEMKFENPLKITFWTDERTLGKLQESSGDQVSFEIIGKSNA